VCPKCKCADQTKFSSIAFNPSKKVRAGLRYCADCKKQFTVTIGTIFEATHIPLRKWLIAWYLVCSSKKGISSLQLQRQLELGNYGSALFMTHRIRYALKESDFAEKLSGTIEADETYIGGRKTGIGGGSKEGKTAVVSLVQRGGDVRSQVMKTVNGNNLKQAIRDNVQICSEVHTDAHMGYRGLEPKFTHKSVKHCAQEFSRHEGETVVTTNSVESFFSLLKRGVIGTFHSISAQYLPLYLAEFDHRYNCRKMTDGERTDNGLLKVEGKRLIYQARA
jgi:transposase-like protein